MQERLLKQTAVFTTIFTVLAVALMVWFQWNKEELLRFERSFVSGGQSEEHQEVVSADTASGFITLEANAADLNGAAVFTFDGKLDEEIQIECDYVNRNMHLFCPKMSLRTVGKCLVEADEAVVNIEQIEAFSSVRDGISGVEITFPVNGYYECMLQQDEKTVNITFEAIKPNEGITVVLDAGHGGTDIGNSFEGMTEKDTTLEIIKMVAENLEKEDIRVFCTRYGDTTATEEDRVAFANAIKADMLVSVHYTFFAEEMQNRKDGLTAVYNGKYFIPEFGSIELANIMSEETIKKVGGVANGMYAAGEEDKLVNGARIPVALLEIDNVITQENKNTLLGEKYLKRIADGISEGILRAKETITQ